MHKDIHFFTTHSAMDTKKIASDCAKEITTIASKEARVIALQGNLGAGKTTFTQGFARALGIDRRIQSPTFVLIKIYDIAHDRFKHFVHIDAYRIETLHEIERLGIRGFFADKDAIVLIEWADRIKKILPNNTIWVSFEHGKKINERTIKINI